MGLWWGFLRLCRTRRQQASIFCICCRLPSRGPFRGTAPGRGKPDNRSQIFLLFSPATPSTRGFRSAPAKERPRLETNITSQDQRDRASRVMILGGMAVGNGMRVPEKFGSSRNASSARIFWAVLGCCRVSPLPTRTSRNPPRSSGTRTLSRRPRVKLPESQQHLVIRLQVAVSSSNVNRVSRTGCRVQIVHNCAKAESQGRTHSVRAETLIIQVGQQVSTPVNYYVSN